LCLTVKTTKCRKIKKKVPIERVFYEKKCTKCPKIVKKAVVVPCTKTITVPSTRVEYKDCTEMVDKVEWVKKCCTEYELISDYEEYECEEKIQVPTWKLEDKEVKYCEEEITWEGKEVCNEKKVRIHEVVDKKVEACMPVKKLVCTTKLNCTCLGNPQKPACFKANHKMVCNVCKKPRERPETPFKVIGTPIGATIPKPNLERKSSNSSTSSSGSNSTHHSDKPVGYKYKKECRNPYCKVCKPNQYHYGIDVNFRKRNSSDGDRRPSPYV